MSASTLLVLALFLTALQVVVPFQDTEAKSEVRFNVMEAVFRYQIKKCEPREPARIFFLSDKGKDLVDEFMARFKSDGPPVRKQSEIGVSEATNEFIDKETGKPAAQLRIDKIKWLSDSEAEVEGSCGYATWSAYGYKYTVVLEEGEWVVKSADRTWVV